MSISPVSATPPSVVSSSSVMEEAKETRAQTAQEAAKGDAQAQRKVAAQGTPSTSQAAKPTVNGQGHVIGQSLNVTA